MIDEFTWGVLNTSDAVLLYDHVEEVDAARVAAELAEFAKRHRGNGEGNGGGADPIVVEPGPPPTGFTLYPIPPVLEALKPVSDTDT